ncbi:O-antigen ligase family protein [Desulfosarcina variabilis]|uniref:O-antigen ligase family protein n=1 Tax=Desulfosarcina variabilis TaxID=2300 RepID=UPI003AFB06CE
MAVLVILAVVVCVIVFPLSSVIIFNSIYIVKPIARVFMPALLYSYTYDMFTLCMGYLGAATLWIKNTPGSVKMRPFPIFVMLFIIFMLAVGLLNTRVPEFGLKKFLIFSVFNFLSLLLPMVLVRNISVANDILKWFLIFGLLLPFIMMIPGVSMQGMSARSTVLGANPLAPAELMNCALLILIVRLLLKPSKKTVTLSILFIPLLIFSIAKTGSRGPLLSSAILTIGLVGIYSRRRVFLISIVSLVIGIGSYLVLSQFLPENLAIRFSKEKSACSMEYRLQLTRITVLRMFRNPIMGNGPGDSAMDVGESDQQGYAHTVVLEVFDEAGIPGGILYFLMFVNAFSVGIKAVRSNPIGSSRKIIALTFVILLAGKFIESFKTGSYAGSNLLYFLLGCLFAVGNTVTQKKSEEGSLKHRPTEIFIRLGGAIGRINAK